jgi:hypothetical protein
MTLITGVQLVYIWFSVAILAWVMPSKYVPTGGVINGIQSTQEDLYQASVEKGSWINQQIMYVPKQDDWPIVIDPNLQPWSSKNNWN